jgi:hypothetical protein
MQPSDKIYTLRQRVQRLNRCLVFLDGALLVLAVVVPAALVTSPPTGGDGVALLGALLFSGSTWLRWFVRVERDYVQNLATLSSIADWRRLAEHAQRIKVLRARHPLPTSA